VALGGYKYIENGIYGFFLILKKEGKGMPFIHQEEKKAFPPCCKIL
jgi:hypothetical protein